MPAAMQDPQPLPVRALALATDDADELSAAQPERRRRYEQLHRGRFRGNLVEVSWGAASVMHERWSCGVRVRCDRPGGYVAFGLLTWARGDVRLCGTPLKPGALVRVGEPWELSSSGPLDLLCFGVGSAALQAAQGRLAGVEGPLRSGNWTRDVRDEGRLALQLLATLRALDAEKADSAALASADADLLRLAARLDRANHLTPLERPPHPSRRRAAVRRVEEYLDANGDEVPSIPELCAVAGVSERTLEYSFHEHLGMTPVRFLRVRRLNRVRRRILAAEPGASVTEIALRAGAYDLGRFAGDYRRLFGELPSDTLRLSTSRDSRRSAVR